MKRHALAIPALVLLAACSSTANPVQPLNPGPTALASRSAPLAGTTSNTITVLNFDSLAASGTGLTCVPSYSQYGFTIFNPAYSGAHAFCVPETGNYQYEGLPALVNNRPNDTTRLTKNDGGTFTPVSIAIAEILPGRLEVPFTGTRADGSTVTATFTIDSVAGFKTFTFPTDFTGVVSLSWLQVYPYHEFTNIVLDPPVLDPQSRAECWNGGWKAFGFINQGQCIRMVETGKDSR